MPDIAHWYGSDLQISASGELLLVANDTLVQQRIVRRLLTNAGDYIWQLAYGAGVGSLVGKVQQPGAVESLVRSQIFQEASGASVPVPTVTTSTDQNGNVVVTIKYTDATTGETQTLSSPVNS
jgi:phage baseplate assembly protein W